MEVARWIEGRIGFKYYTRGSEIKLTGRPSPLLHTRTLDLREERKVNSKSRQVGNRTVHKSRGHKELQAKTNKEGTKSCKPKQTQARRLSSC